MPNKSQKQHSTFLRVDAEAPLPGSSVSSVSKMGMDESSTSRANSFLSFPFFFLSFPFFFCFSFAVPVLIPALIATWSARGSLSTPVLLLAFRALLRRLRPDAGASLAGASRSIPKRGGGACFEAVPKNSAFLSSHKTRPASQSLYHNITKSRIKRGKKRLGTRVIST